MEELKDELTRKLANILEKADLANKRILLAIWQIKKLSLLILKKKHTTPPFGKTQKPPGIP